MKEEIKSKQKNWNRILLMGGYSALIVFVCILFDIIYGSISSSDLSVLPNTAIERFNEFQSSWFIGLYHLDLLNVIISIITIPVMYNIFTIHKKSNYDFSLIALILTLIGTAVFISANSALSMMELSNKYFLAIDDNQRNLIAAAGEVVLVSGEHGGLGAFLGFFISTLGSISMACVMLNGKIFSRVTSWFGVIGHSLLLIYIVIVTFVPSIESVALAIAAPGGIMALVWILMVGIKLIKLAKQENSIL